MYSKRVARTAERVGVPKTNPVGRLHLLAKGGVAVVRLILQAACVLAGGALIDHVLHADTLVPDRYALAAAYVALIAIVSLTMTNRRAGRELCVLDIWTLLTALTMSLIASGQTGGRQWLAAGVWFVVSAAAILAVRSSCSTLAERIRSRILPPRPIAFIGNSASAARMLAQIDANPRSEVRPIGYFDDRNSRPGPLTNVLPFLGTIDDLVGYIHDFELTDVYMAMPWSAAERMSELLARLRFLPLTVRLLPDAAPPALRGRDEGEIEGVVMPTLMIPPFSAVGGFLKRSLDVAAACCLLVPLAPLFLLVALLIRLDSKGPVFFRQVRSGQHGRSFLIYKFRTLHMMQADAAAETLVTHGDKRVTRVGRILRKYSIDELPQVFNVILGNMSLVGPRPHAPRAKADGRIYAEVMPDYMLRYRVKPGMTGWAQVNGWRGNTDTEEQLRKRVEFDFDYITRWSLGRDFEILARTVPSMLMPPAANS